MRDEAGRKKAALVIWILVFVFVAWATAPPMAPEKVNVRNLRGAAKNQALEQLARQ